MFHKITDVFGVLGFSLAGQSEQGYFWSKYRKSDFVNVMFCPRDTIIVCAVKHKTMLSAIRNLKHFNSHRFNEDIWRWVLKTNIVYEFLL